MAYKRYFKEYEIDLEKGDEILMGKFLNKRATVKDFGTDEKGQPTVISDKGEKPMLKFRIKKLMPESVKDFKGSDSDIQELKDWINSLNLKTGKAPSGMKKQYEDLKFLVKQIEMLSTFGKNPGIISNIRVTLEHLTDKDIEILTKKLSKDARTSELKLKNATFTNNSVMSDANFIKNAKAIDSFLSSLKGFHKDALKGELKIVFVKKEDTKAKATYKSDKDALYLRADAIKPGSSYGQFNYVVVHELGHRYLKFNKVKFDYQSSKWITTPYSKTEGWADEEKFAELFALSHFNYSGQPFDSYKEKIDEFVSLLN